MKDNKLKKVFDKCKVIHALKQPKNLLHLLNRPKVQNCISEKYGLYRNEWKDSRCNLCASYIQECSNFVTSNGYNWKIRHSSVLYYLQASQSLLYPYKLLFFSKIPIFSCILINTSYISYIFMKNLEIVLDKTLNCLV